jgi:hypothetical protein
MGIYILVWSVLSSAIYPTTLQKKQYEKLICFTAADIGGILLCNSTATTGAGSRLQQH